MIIYHYDNAGNLTVPESVVDTSDIPAGATQVAPIYHDGTAIINPIWNGDSWQGDSNGKFVANLVGFDQSVNAQILLMIAKNKTDQDKINAQLLLASASNQLGGGQNE